MIIAIIAMSALGLTNAPIETKQYLRLHVRANSNSQIDQDIKYQVKDAVVNYLTPFISECDSHEKAENMLLARLKGIEKVADSVLEQNGFSYRAKASVKVENFPTRFYGNLTLEEGFYKALIINLGSGEGDNWWCVVYPPLCFTGSNSPIKYRSKILDIINSFIKGESK